MTSPGDLITVWFPFRRHEPEPYKRRPVLVIGVPPATRADEALLVLMVTSNARRVRYPGATDILLDHGSGSGLTQPSVVRLSRAWTAEGRDVAGTLGAISPVALAEITRAFRLLYWPDS
jgi:mRNA-degrading endonuclease toxin of MazEF toxin-antitoxin module